ncbi:MAG TPA: response regulator [Xanthobacteraceae bacterium]
MEDEVLVRLMICDELRERGFRVIEAVSADEAADVLQTSSRVDLIISDIKMPGRLDGLALARHVEAHHAGLPMILASAAYWNAAELPSCVRGLFPKPYAVDRVVHRICEVLNVNPTPGGDATEAPAPMEPDPAA